jgi:MFS family permease
MFGVKTALKNKEIDKLALFTILVAALGYFVDVFDLLLFSIVRVQSLKDLGIPAADMLSTGIVLINSQMAGLLIGGILWGVLADKLGRRSVMFGSILFYSLGNIANGFVHDVNAYAALRFIAGIGLAGELGAGITLISELLPPRLRGLGTSFISGIGILGAVFAVLVASYTDWRIAYITGGAIGLILLAMRMNVAESGMHQKLVNDAPHIERGNVMIFFRNLKLFRRLLKVIWVGAPIWVTVGLFITFTPEFAKDFGMTTMPTASLAVLSCYAGTSIGSFVIGWFSQRLKSRKRALAIFMGLLAITVLVYANLPYGDNVALYYGMCGLMGLFNYWAMFIQLGTEQFGTNIRATAATCAPNFVRALTIPYTIAFRVLIPTLGVTYSGVAVMMTMIVIAFIALGRLQETFGKDLDFQEV